MAKRIRRAVLVAAAFAWPLTPEALARLVRRARSYREILPRATRNRTDLVGWLARRPGILAAVNTYETAVLGANGLEPRVKYLASLKASSLTGCPF